MISTKINITKIIKLMRTTNINLVRGCFYKYFYTRKSITLYTMHNAHTIHIGSHSEAEGARP